MVFFLFSLLGPDPSPPSPVERVKVAGGCHVLAVDESHERWQQVLLKAQTGDLRWGGSSCLAWLEPSLQESTSSQLVCCVSYWPGQTPCELPNWKLIQDQYGRQFAYWLYTVLNAPYVWQIDWRTETAQGSKTSCSLLCGYEWLGFLYQPTWRGMLGQPHTTWTIGRGATAYKRIQRLAVHWSPISASISPVSE